MDTLREALSAWARRPGESGTETALGLLDAAEKHLTPSDGTDASSWHEYLDVTGNPDFLETLPDAAARHRWAENSFRAIGRSRYSLDTMLQQRAAAHPDRLLFIDKREPTPSEWSYAQVAWYARSLAGVFLESIDEPRVAIFADNSIDTACADLACLLHGILVSPLNVHFDIPTIAWIFDRLAINIVITDTDERLSRLAEVQAKLGRTFKTFRSGEHVAASNVRGLDVTPLRPACARIDPAAAAARLAARPIDLTAAATVMFTSGSTGQPKGVVFSQYNLVTKRFARAAALPTVGRNEVLLCYLPLFHTFGRFLEMLGTIYWRGTYVFAGSPTAEGLIAELGRVRPTGLISVPVRWTQIREQCLENMERETDSAAEDTAFREIVGGRLRWGLSAAGYLDPLVFRFFQRHGVDLCSGFGMTEATGGITMTPPGSYVDGTVGIPLPGMRIRLGEHGELQIAGPFVARYLDEHAPSGSIPCIDPDDDHWIATGDLFREHAGGYLEIVDRIKDIYKNSRGQTIAPQRVEQRFASVPGIRRTFLAGDHRDHNVLLIVLNREDPVLATRTDDEVHEYLGQIVAAVNEGLAPYERVVRFTVLDRDFDGARRELTEKGSLRRKVIAEHFGPVIETLYRSNHVEFSVDGTRVRIPRWFFRDLAVLEDDIASRPGGLHNKRNDAFLPLVRQRDGSVRVGDLLYRLGDGVIDLGLFARQPRLWIGNPSLVAFSPCKPGWELALRGVSEQVRLPVEAGSEAIPLKTGDRIGDERLRELHDLAVPALFGTADQASRAIEGLAELLARVDARVASVIRRRLEALAYRPEEEVRALAYRVLVLDEPIADYDRVFPAFVESGLTFLNEASIAAIARSRQGERRLQALRQRLYSYRTGLDWPGPALRRAQFTRVFRLLADFARHDRESFPAVEAELACWALFREDPVLARAAETELQRLTAWHEETIARTAPAEADATATAKVVFEFGISADQREHVRAVLFDRTFLSRSLSHAFGEDGFDWKRVAPDGAWVSSILSHHPLHLYRLGINFSDGRHFDLLLVLGDTLRKKKAVGDTVLWMTALSGHAFGPSALPRFGAWRKDLGAIAIAYISDLTAWERIRELSREQDVRDSAAKRWAWRKLYVRAMAVFLRAWEHSGYRIVPGALTPANVAVPAADFHEGTSILSLAGWRTYQGAMPFVMLLFRNFYRQTEAHYPQSRETLQVSWMFDACVEALGQSGAVAFFDELAKAMADTAPAGDRDVLRHALVSYRATMEARPYVPLPVLCAVQRFVEWERVNANASHDAREEAVVQMIHLYRLERFHEAFRYYVYQHTYFARAGAEIHAVFERLLARRLGTPGARPGQLEELSELQNLMMEARDRDVFSRMVFPQSKKTQQLEIFEVGQTADRRVLVRSIIRDTTGNAYEVRRPITPVEIGHLYRLILEADYPKRFTAEDRHLIIADPEERIVGGLFYRWEESKIVYVDGIVVSSGLRHQGLGGRLLEDFCVRMAAQGARCVKTNFFLGQLFSKHGFTVNQRWGGLVRFLGAPESQEVIGATEH